MSDKSDDVTELAKATLEYDEHCAGGEWEAHWDGTLGRSSVYARAKRSAPADVQIMIARRGYGGIPPEAAFIAHSRTAAPDLARAWLAVMGALEDERRLYGGAGIQAQVIDDIRAAIERRLKEGS